MAEKTLFALTLRLTTGKLGSSKLTILAGVGFPAFLAWIGLSDSYETAVRFFLFLFPYAFLLAARDMAGTEIECGWLENVLFLGGRHKDYLWRKNFAVALAAGIYTFGLFLIMAAWGLALGKSELGLALRFGLGILAGLYYVSFSGALSYRMKSSANVMAVLLVQAAAALALLFSATARNAFIDNLVAGRFPGFSSKLLFFGLLAVCPNLVAARKLASGAVFVAAGMLVSLAGQRVLLRRLDLRK